MDNNTRNKEESSNRVESRIELLKQEILAKDEKLKSLVEDSKTKDAQIAALQNDVSKENTSGNTFAPAFQGAEEDQDFSEISEERPEAFKKQIEIIQKREQKVKEMLGLLEDAFKVLKQRNTALNQKEETLNREYLKLLEIESMYKGTDQLADSLGSVLPSFDLESEKKKDYNRVTEKNNEE
ncbi:MAG: hypothetical protein RR310_03640 [Eubacterium sp.]